jgi:ATP-dependent DNA helicase RecQ
MLVGQTEELPDALAGLSTTGLLSEHEPKVIEKWIDALVGAGALIASPDIYRTLRLSGIGREVMAGRQSALSLLVPSVRTKGEKIRKPKKGRSAPALLETSAQPEEGLLAALREWRRDEARAKAIPAYVILHDKTLDAIAIRRPKSESDLAGIPGIGPSKLAAYGEAILKVLDSQTGAQGKTVGAPGKTVGAPGL